MQRIISSTLVLITEVKGLALNWLRMNYVDNVCCGMRVISSPRMVFATHHTLSCDSRLCPKHLSERRMKRSGGVGEDGSTVICSHE